jgi:DNA modification methylase
VKDESKSSKKVALKRNSTSRDPRVQEVRMEIISKSIAELRFADYNPRKLSAKQADDLRKSLKGFGIVEPAVINAYPGRENIVIGGEQRIRQAQKLGYREFPCYLVSLPEEKERELNVRLNRNTGEWDFALLEEHFQGNDLVDWGFEKGDLPFDLDGGEPSDTVGDDDIPESDQDAPVRTKRGDLYELHSKDGGVVHRLYCGDSTIASDLDQLAGPTEKWKAKLLFTSPPYNMKATLYAHYQDNRHQEDFITFNINVLLNWKRVLERYAFVFWNMSYNKNSGSSFLEVYYHFITKCGLVFLEDICWDKGHGMPLSEQLTRQYEHLLVLNESLENVHFIDHVGVFGTKRVPFLKAKKKGITNYWRIDTFKSQNDKIRAAFPVELPSRAIEITTNPGDMVVDPFGGSGTTLIAAEKNERSSLTMEIDPSYCDLIVKRWTDFMDLNHRPWSIRLNGQPITQEVG